ncbi:hypothetical protein Tco_1308168, partial [Tanacetum coccineum]
MAVNYQPRHDGTRPGVVGMRKKWAAISGAVFSIEVFESSLVLWKSDESGVGCASIYVPLLQIDVIVSLLSGRLVRERIGPAMLSAVQSQGEGGAGGGAVEEEGRWRRRCGGGGGGVEEEGGGGGGV